VSRKRAADEVRRESAIVPRLLSVAKSLSPNASMAAPFTSATTHTLTWVWCDKHWQLPMTPSTLSGYARYCCSPTLRYVGLWFGRYHVRVPNRTFRSRLIQAADTEIDWKAYMQQVTIYLLGQRDYVKIYGDTGPLVYPAAHVYIYRVLHYFTDDGRWIYVGQYVFVGLYLATLVLVMQCYRQAKVPPYVYPLLIMSKRLHSIFMLRLFNDCFAVFFLFLAIFCYQRRLWTAGSLAYSFGLGVKMSLLLALPAVGIILWQGMGRDRALRQAMLMGQLQVGNSSVGRGCSVDVNGRYYLAIPFLQSLHGATSPVPSSSPANSCSSGP
jgi:hypothetical protein